MFVEAIEKAAGFTFPLIISNKYQDGTISSSLGSFIVLNEEGWILTAAHIVQETALHQAHLEEYRNHIAGDGSALNPQWILHHSLWFGADHHRVNQFQVLPENDLALGKIENFDPNFVREYPRFIAPEAVKPGRSVCKLGFPFYDIQATFSENAFRYNSALFPIPHFPYEGLVTRIISGTSGKADATLWLETSSPGLRGQSGGPVFDASGRVWGIQSMTRHLPLGFSPSIQKNGMTVEENQFINLGWSVHVGAIFGLLDKHGVRYYRADDTA